MFTYTAADGKTKLHGLIHFPSNFDPSKKYPALAGVYGGPASAATQRALPDAEPADRVRVPRPAARLARGPRHGQAHARSDLPEARPGRDGRHDGGRQVALQPALLRQEPRRHLRLVVRRLQRGDDDPPLSRRLRGGVGRVAADRLAQLRHDLHRALHVDPRGEQGRLRRRRRDDLRRQPEGAPAHLLRHRRQQRAPERTRCS